MKDLSEADAKRWFELSCATKDRMTRSVARSVAKRMRANHNSPLMAYKCEFCRGWHVGNRPFNERRRRG